MHVTLRIECDRDRLWDTLIVQAWDEQNVINWFKRDIFSGQGHDIALQKGQLELETLLTKLGWLEPGSR